MLGYVYARLLIIWTCNNISKVNHKLLMLNRSVYFIPPHVPNGGDVDVLYDNASTHMSSIDDISME